MEKLSKYVGIRGGVSRRAFERLAAFRRDVEQALPYEIDEVVLFGSRARGEATKDADYDVAIFVKEGGAGTLQDRQLSNIAFPYLLKGVHIRPVSLPRNFLNSDFQYPLAFSIAREGVLLS